MSFWSLSWKTLKNRRGYFYSRWGWCQAWGWGWQSSYCGLHSSYHLSQQCGSSRLGPAGPTGPTGPGGPGGGSGGGGGGAGPPPGPPLLPPGGTGAAISKIQCNNKLNLTLLVDNWSIDQPSTACASVLVTCMLLWAHRLQVTLVACYNNSQ